MLDKKIFITEQNYEEILLFDVQPYLNNCLDKGFFKSFDGNDIYYEHYRVQKPSSSIVIVHGFTESIEKYKEMIWYFLKSNIEVFGFDSRGHGQSYREIENFSISHINDFEEYVKDLDIFFKKVVNSNMNSRKLYLYAHSAGGATAARFLQLNPKIFDKAILSSPMIQPNPGDIPLRFGSFLVNFMCGLGLGKRKVFVHKFYQPNERFEHSPCTSSNRFIFYAKKRSQNKYYQNNAATYSWVKNSLSITKKLLNRDLNQKIETEILLFSSGKDTLVLNQPQKEYIQTIKKGTLKEFPNAKHELFMSEDSVVEEYVNQILDFLK